MAQCYRRAGTKTLSILTQSMRKKKMSYENAMKTRYRAKPYDIFNGSKRTTIEANIHVWKLRKLKEISQSLTRSPPQRDRYESENARNDRKRECARIMISEFFLGVRKRITRVSQSDKMRTNF